MSVIVAYNMYIECCEGGLDSEWFVEAKDRMTFRDFRLLLSEQMMTYDPREQLYHGDENFRKVTRLGKRKKKGTVTYWKGEKGEVILENYKIAKTSSHHSPSCLCGPLDDFEKHIARGCTEDFYKKKNFKHFFFSVQTCGYGVLYEISSRQISKKVISGILCAFSRVFFLFCWEKCVFGWFSCCFHCCSVTCVDLRPPLFYRLFRAPIMYIFFI